MAKIKKAINIGLRGIRKWGGSPRVLLIAVFMILSIYHMTGAISQFSADVNIKTAPWVFPFLSSDFYMQTVMMIGVVFLFCDAPFVDESAPYVIVRSGRFTWASGQMIYIFVGSLIYILFLVITSIVCILPSVEFQEGWGKVIGTLSMTNASQQYQTMVGISSKIIHSYTPAVAMGLSILLSWMMSCFLALLMYVLNSYINRAAGSMVACGVVMFNYFVYNLAPDDLNAYSPAALTNLSILNSPEKSDSLTTSYAIVVMSVLLIVFVALSVLSIRKRKIEVLQPV